LDRDDWQGSPDWQRLDPEERRQLAEETREMLLLLAAAHVKQAPKDQAVLREALLLLDRAGEIQDLAPSPALWQDRAGYLSLLGEETAARAAQAEAKQIRPSSARDHYLLAATYIRQGSATGYKQGITELTEAIRLNPRHYWSHFQRAMCFNKLGDATMAAGDYGTCIGLWPEFAWAYFNRGYVLHQTGKHQEAFEDYTAALERDPKFANAYVNRGLLCLERQQFAQALADYNRAAELGWDDASVHAGRGIALEGLRQSSQADAAFAAAFERLDQAAASVRSKILWTYAFAVAPRLPEEAWQAFQRILKEEPNHRQALYGCGWLRSEQQHPDEALPYFNRAIEADASFLEPRRARAVLLARRRQFAEAIQDINRCLEKDRHSGPVLYGAACVSALTAAAVEDAASKTQWTQKALSLLHEALQHGYGQDRAAQDPDLAALRTQPQFHKLVEESTRKGPQ
jgi:tetratricopeptide (TPR) repeat protein